MGNYGKPKKIVGRNFRANLLLYSCIKSYLAIYYILLLYIIVNIRMKIN